MMRETAFNRAFLSGIKKVVLDENGRIIAVSGVLKGFKEVVQ